MVNAQEYISQKYPVQEERTKTKELSIKNQSLEGKLDLSDFINLKTLWCSNNKLTSINVNNCPHLEKIYCQNNQLTSLDIGNCHLLIELNCSIITECILTKYYLKQEVEALEKKHEQKSTN